MGNREFYCMDLTTQLMPDLTTDMMYQIYRQNDLHPKNHKTKELFELLKKKLEKILDSNVTDNKLKHILQNRLKMIHLGILSAGNTNAIQSIYDQLQIGKDEYQNNILKLLKQFRRTIYSLANTEVSPASLYVTFAYIKTVIN